MTDFEARLLKAYHVLNPCKVDRGLQAWFHRMTALPGLSVSASTVRRWMLGTVAHASTDAACALYWVEARARNHLDAIKGEIGT